MNKQIAAVIVLFLLLFSNIIDGKANIGVNPGKDTSNYSIIYKTDAFVSIIDSLVNIDFNDTLANQKSKSNQKIDSIPVFEEMIYEYRMAELNGKTPIELQYNSHVRRYIDLYSNKRRNDVSKMLGLSKLYFPIFEEQLDKYGLPLELKYLAIVESALNPNACSSSGATGLWQFMFNASKMFNLEINSYVDERRDPHKSTEAACKYLKYLHRIFNDWQLALAAYNGGPGVVRNAIQRSGGKTDFWQIRQYLPVETQNYVPAFMAVNYVMNYTTEHNIFEETPLVTFYRTDTVKITQAVSFKQISAVIEIPISTLKFLNPSFKQNYIPYIGNPSTLVLPADKVSKFIAQEKEVYGYVLPIANYNTLLANAGSTENKVKKTHIVKKGEYFHKIAMDYDCTIENIMAWNKLKNKNLCVGQKLAIWVNSEMPQATITNTARNVCSSNTEQYLLYTVQDGDTIKSMADKFNYKSINDFKEFNNLKEEEAIKPGEQIKIYSINN